MGAFADQVLPASKNETTVRRADPAIGSEAQLIVEKVALLFTRITGVSVDGIPVRIQFVDNLKDGDKIITEGGHVEGITHYPQMGPLIEIANDRSSSWQRVLAHEVTHVFVNQVYGRAYNSTLNEGLAEFIAEAVSPDEVRSSMKKLSKRSSLEAQYRPYLEGFRFCKEHAEDERFPEFLASEIQSRNSPYPVLKALWDRAGRK